MSPSLDIRPCILVVEDEPDHRDALVALLGEGYDVRTAADGEQALATLRTTRVQGIILDVTLPGMDGFEFLERLHERDGRVPVIMLTASRSVGTAVQALRLGVEDYITKPWDPEELLLALGRAVSRAKLLDRVEACEATRESHVTFDDLVSASPATRKLIELAKEIAETDSRVLITGETGTGKELLARAIHHAGPRRDRPFVAVNCGAIPQDLAESEFFGHEKGAFTGAIRAKRGKFELANEGTLFLDEIGCLPVDLQAKLLRALQDGMVDRVGGEAPLPVDVRVIAATNQDLRAEVDAGRFRDDLYYRLNVVPIALPPLRERREDTEVLLEHFRDHFNRRARKSIEAYTEDARRLLCAYGWPGNVRELEHTVERLVILEKSRRIGTDHLPVDIVGAEPARTPSPPVGPMPPIVPLREARERFEREYIREALERASWNQTRTAALLCVNRNTLITKLRQYGLKAPGKPQEPLAQAGSRPASGVAR